MRNLAFSTLHEATIGVQQACDSTSMPDLHLKPYSRFSEVDSTLWWLCPVKTRTAFKQGKFVLGKPSRFGFDSGILCGLHVERGVKKTVGSLDWKLGPDWKWHKFISDFDSVVPNAVELAFSLVAEPIDVFVFASAVGAVERVRFTSTGKTLSLEEANGNATVLTDTSKCGSWADLGRNLDLLTSDADWYWIDVFITTRYSLDLSAASDLDVCTQVLECFQDWLGSP